MGRKWTPEERKEHLRNYYPEKRRKLGVTIGVIVMLLLICAALGFAIRAQTDVGLIFILTIILVVAVLASVFIMDTTFHESF